MRRLVAVRKEHLAFGRGTMTLLYPRNRKILAYVREHEGECILCVANLSSAAQAVELDLARWKGSVPIEMAGRSAFPPIGDLPYLVTLPGYGFYWFLLAEEAAAPQWHLPLPEVLPEFVTLTTRDGRIDTALAGRNIHQFDDDVLPTFLKLQRWFGAKDREIKRVTLTPLAPLEQGAQLLTTIDVETDGSIQRYFLPLSTKWGDENVAFGAPKLSYTIAKLRRGSRVGALVDGAYDEDFTGGLLGHLRERTTLSASDGGHILFHSGPAMARLENVGSPRPLGVEQSNVSIAYGDSLILKIYRRLREGLQPDVEVARFLTETAGFENTPAFLGCIEHKPAEGEATTLAAAFAFVRNQGDAWEAVTTALQRDINEVAGPGHEPALADEPLPFLFPLSLGEVLGRRTAELHDALAIETDDPAFQAEPIGTGDVETWVRETTDEVAAMLSQLRSAQGRLDADAAAAADAVLTAEARLTARINAAASIVPQGYRTRIHGDYHLGQVLVAQNDLMIIDFEGEPGRSLQERRSKSSPLRDVAGMLRSLDYAAATVERLQDISTAPNGKAVLKRLRQWRDETSAGFLSAYFTHGSGRSKTDEQSSRALLDVFLIQKAAYEIGYELANRPSWVGIPLRGLLDLIAGEPS
jgi:maltose alpha-D-glucosyltransferase/alpha-amylase